jgi:hypothetical protein
MVRINDDNYKKIVGTVIEFSKRKDAEKAWRGFISGCLSSFILAGCTGAESAYQLSSAKGLFASGRIEIVQPNLFGAIRTHFTY